MPDVDNRAKTHLAAAGGGAQQFRVTDFAGSAREAVDFVNACWSAQFPENITCPQWDEDYFDWQMFAQPQNIRLAAYHGSELVGFVFGEPLQLLWKHRSVFAMFSTALAADPALKGMGIAKALAAELNLRLQAGGMAFVYGFAVPGPGSQGPKFWQGSQAAQRVKSIGIRPWIRPLNADVLTESAGTRFERIAAKTAGTLRLDAVRTDKDPHVRPFRPEDLSSCLALVRAAEADADLRYDWTLERLAHQLAYKNISKTYVYDDGELRGFVNFHQLWFRGRRRFSAGMIDHLIAVDAQSDVQKALLLRALADMRDAGQALAICPSSAGANSSVKFGNGFVPLPETYDCMYPFMSAGYEATDLKTVRVHLR